MEVRDGRQSVSMAATKPHLGPSKLSEEATGRSSGTSRRRYGTQSKPMWIVAVSLVVVSASHMFDLVVGGIVPVVQALNWIWMVLAIVVTIGAAAFRQHVVAALCLLAACLALWPLLSPSAYASCQPGRPSLSVLSVNGGVASANVGQLRREILDRKVDIVVLLEIDEPMLNELRSGTVLQQLPHVSAAPSAGGVAGSVIMTRFRQVAVTPAKAVGDPRFVFDQPAVRVDVGGTSVLVHAVHTYPPIASGADAWRQALRNLGQWQRGYRDEPVLIAGDFNASRVHPSYRYAAHDLDEASRAEGRLSLPTWPAGSVFPPFVALDHILTRDFSAKSFERIRIEGTDHKAIAAQVMICSS